MFREILLCDGCLIERTQVSDSREDLIGEAEAKKWLKRRGKWYCPKCRLAIEHKDLAERSVAT